MTVTEIINIAIVSQYKWAVSILKGGLFGGGTPNYLPQLIQSVRENVEWKFDQEGINDGLRAYSSITFDSLGGVGAEYVFDFDDPDLGNIELGSYTEQSGDTTTSTLAYNAAIALNLNSYGYTFIATNNAVICYTPLRVASASNGLQINCTITVLSVTLGTVATSAVNAAPSSADSVAYILQVDNDTASSQTITNVLTYVRGTHVAGDFFSIDAYYNTTPDLSGASYLNSVAPIDSNVTQYDIAVSQAVGAGNTGYIVLVLSVNAGPVAGRTGYIEGGTDPVELIITGSPSQVDNQTNSSGVVTIT